MILSKNLKNIGAYRLTMKSGSDNFRSSAIQDIITTLRENDANVVIYEPTIKEDTFNDIAVCHDLSQFKEQSDIIIANRITDELKDVKEKVYTRDLFSRD